MENSKTQLIKYQVESSLRELMEKHQNKEATENQKVRDEMKEKIGESKLAIEKEEMERRKHIESVKSDVLTQVNGQRETFEEKLHALDDTVTKRVYEAEVKTFAAIKEKLPFSFWLNAGISKVSMVVQVAIVIVFIFVVLSSIIGDDAATKLLKAFGLGSPKTGGE